MVVRQEYLRENPKLVTAMLIANQRAVSALTAAGTGEIIRIGAPNWPGTPEAQAAWIDNVIWKRRGWSWITESDARTLVGLSTTKAIYQTALDPEAVRKLFLLGAGVSRAAYEATGRMPPRSAFDDMDAGRARQAGVGSRRVEPQGLSRDAAERIARRFSLHGRRALVTGGTLSIGRAIVRAFADAGAHLAIHHAAAADTALGEEGAEAQLARELDALGVRHVLIDADFAIPGEARRAVERAVRALGGVDVLVVCASVQQREAFADIGADTRERQTQINFHARSSCCRRRSRDARASLGPDPDDRQREPDAPGSRARDLRGAQERPAQPRDQPRAAARRGRHHGEQSVAGLVATSRNKWRRTDARQWQAIQAARIRCAARRIPRKWPARPCSCAPTPAASSPGPTWRPPAAAHL
jgi:NAD(P)-dependent dehydrogenase (short-subunit alcohol dehydrogenase family)